ncbi:MAG: VCBS repeat-containing protein [Planctomycetota bacterium]
MLVHLALLTAASLPQVPQDFPTPRVVSEARDGGFEAHGDFDNDGDLDLLHYHQGASGWTALSVFENVGNGQFVRGPLQGFPFAAAAYPGTDLRPHLGDFNGDGNLDFVIARSGPIATPDRGLQFFFGDGNRSWSTMLMPMPGPSWLAVGNCDGDAADEIAVSYSDAGYQRMLAWVDVQAGAPVLLPSLPINTAGVPAVFVFATADVDGDGVDDIAATATMSLVVDRLQFFPTVAGVPTVGAAFPLNATLQNINHRLLAGDLDGDGDRDLLLLKMATGDAGQWVQPLERTAGGWTQHPEQLVPATNFVWLQASNGHLVDWNGDGWLDVVTGGGECAALRSLGNWQFAQGFLAPGTGQRRGGGPFDFDGDGHVDMVSAFSVLYGDGTFDYLAETSLPTATELVLDREGDGDVDLTAVGEGLLARNDGTGAFTVVQRGFPPLGADEHYDPPIAYADFDGDGRREFLVHYFHQTFFPFSPRTPLGMLRITDDHDDTFAPGVPATASAADVILGPTTASSPLWDTGDVDGDGDLDLLLVDGYRVNDGAGMLSAFVSAWSGRGRQCADLDGDGDVDVVTTSFGFGTTAVALQLAGPGGFTAVPLTSIAGAADVLLRDLDGDLDLDLMAGSTSAPGLLLFENVAGVFVQRAAIPEVFAARLQHIGVRDFDGDGLPDLLVVSGEGSQSSGNYYRLSRYHGTGTDLGFVLVNEHLAPFGANGFADVDGDGDLDAIGGPLLRSTMAPVGSGAIRQYGDGTGGSAGITPLLGARGPIVSTSTADELRIVRGWPGASGLLVFGLVETTLPNAPLGGLVLHVGDPLVLYLPPLGGTPSVPGTGELTITLPDLPFLAGFTVVHQVFTQDPTSPSGWASSNGLALTYGN